jgi:hypothetical protein
MISAKIDVTKLDKSSFFKGAKGTYCDITLIDKPSEYGDGFIVQDLGKERRLAGERGPIIGNWKETGQAKPQQTAPVSSPAYDEDHDGTIPF